MEELRRLQTELSVPKGQYNKFADFNYRSCEDILEAVKPMLKEMKCTLTLHDELVVIGDRYYIKATAMLINEEGGQVSNTGYAREAAEKKGMDLMQLTGACSSYARKYALTGLLLLDDNKDADSMDNSPQADKKQPAKQLISAANAKKLNQLVEDYGADKEAFCAYFKVKEIKGMSKDDYGTAIEMLNTKYGGAE